MFDDSNAATAMQNAKDADVPQPPALMSQGPRQRCGWCEKEVMQRPCAHWDQFISCAHSKEACENLMRD